MLVELFEEVMLQHLLSVMFILNRLRHEVLTFIALMADFVMEIILAREIGGFESIKENNYTSKQTNKQKHSRVDLREGTQLVCKDLRTRFFVKR